MTNKSQILLTITLWLLGVGIHIPALTQTTADTALTTFRGFNINIIKNPERLQPIFDRIHQGKDVVRIVQIGDSHIQGHILPQSVRSTLEAKFGSAAFLQNEFKYPMRDVAVESGSPGVIFSAIGKNGATCATFATTEKMAQLASLHPDVVILSFGTNESYGRGYQIANHASQIHTLSEMISKYCPNTVLFFTTPPGNYWRRRQRFRNSRKRRYRTIKIVNPNTTLASETIETYADTYKWPIWNLFNIAGGINASKNWYSHHMFQKDRIHFTHDGYALQGHLLGEAFINAYEQYINSK